MRIILSLTILVLLSGSIILDTFSQDTVEEEVSHEEIYNKLKKKYSRKVDKTGLMERKVLEYNEKKYGANSVETLGPIEALAWISTEQQNFKEAEELYQRAIKIRKEQLPLEGENIEELAAVYFMLGDTYLYRSRFARAIVSYDESINYTTDPGHRGDALSRQGIAGEGQEEYQKALDYYLAALKEYDAAKTLYPENTILIDKRMMIVYKRIPELYHKLGENAKVKEYQDLIEEINTQEEEEAEEN